ncbi:MAG: tRNA (adenosine(37)-N6)-dimethylallyltransferase MiaA [Anaerolineales bacterium]
MPWERNGPLILIVGPTAVGKTALSIRLAERFGGEIVSADSRQIYRGMDIGTAKATPEERARVPHHLLDMVSPDQWYTVAEFQEAATQAIADIHRRGRLPFLVGGSGLYVRAVAEGLEIPRVPPNPELRAELDALAAADPDALRARLAELDPQAAARIDPRNVRRVIRALEVCLSTGKPISQLQTKRPPDYRMLWIGLTLPRAELYRRIDARVERMLELGLVEEVRRLAAQGYSWDAPAMTGVGYRQIGAYLRGECSLDVAVREIKRATRRFVRQQANWFRADDPRIRWLRSDEDAERQAAALIQGFLEGKEDV